MTMTDLAEKEGLRVPHLSVESVEQLREFIPPAGNSVMNPLDLGFEAYRPDAFSVLLKCLREDPNIDALFFLQPIGVFHLFMGRLGVKGIIELTLHIKDKLGKPFYPIVESDDVFGGQEYIKDVTEQYHEGGLPTFPSFEIGAKVLNNLWNYQKYLSSMDQEESRN